MLDWLGQQFTGFWGPFRLLNSHLFLATLGAMAAAVVNYLLLDRFQKKLPPDRGKDLAVEGDKSRGKPTAAGVIFIPVTLVIGLLVVPFRLDYLAIFGLVFLAMLSGYYDDRAAKPWGEYRKGFFDLVIASLAAIAIFGFDPVEIWLPFYAPKVAGVVASGLDPAGLQPLLISSGYYLPLATVILWVSINATNCSDGVDGLSGTLLAFAFLCLGGLLYGVVGHQEISAYLLVPFYPDGADWAILSFTFIGALFAYLWFNAHPSHLLMGDAGSRPLGLLLGILVLAAGNPFLILVTGMILLANGATGLVKVALLRFLQVGIFKKVRFPFHDHCRENWGWSNTQVLVRFMILQALLTPLLIVLFLKIR